MVPLEGLEPPRLAALRSKRSASTIPPQGHITGSFCFQTKIEFLLIAELILNLVNGKSSDLYLNCITHLPGILDTIANP
jgi:hypothetical protein